MQAWWHLGSKLLTSSALIRWCQSNFRTKLVVYVKLSTQICTDSNSLVCLLLFHLLLFRLLQFRLLLFCLLLFRLLNVFTSICSIVVKFWFTKDLHAFAEWSSSDRAITLHNWFWEGTLAIHCYQLPNCNGQGLFLSLCTSDMEEDSAIRPAGQLPRRGKYQEVL